MLLPCTQQHQTCLGLEEKPALLHEFLQDPHRHPDIGECGHTWLGSELDVVWVRCDSAVRLIWHCTEAVQFHVSLEDISDGLLIRCVYRESSPQEAFASCRCQEKLSSLLRKKK